MNLQKYQVRPLLVIIILLTLQFQTLLTDGRGLRPNKEDVDVIDTTNKEDIDVINTTNKDVDVTDTTNNLSVSSRILSPVIKSPSDKREYRTLELANQMKVILVHDPKADDPNSAAALTVKAGFLNDPEELPGLAHYLEHFLFIDDQGEDVLDKFLAENGGTSSNAYTKSSITSYYFHCPHQSFEGALNVFSNMFIDPLLSEKVRESVAEAVESEFQGGASSDTRRIRRVNHALSNSSHPHSRIFGGNKFTLWSRPFEKSIDVRAELLKYFEKYYSARDTSLAVISQKSLDELQLLVEKYFNPIKNNNDTQPSLPGQKKMGQWGSPWGPDDLQTQIDIVPLNEIQDLFIIFPISDDLELHSSGAANYLRSLIGGSGPGSLLSLLKRKKWVSSMTMDFDSPGKGYAAVTLQFKLTLEGVENVENIILHTFQYIEMLGRIGPQNWYWNQLRRLKDTAFMYKEDSTSVQDFVSEMTEQMVLYPLDQAWTSRYQPLTRTMTTKFPPHLISHLLSFFTPQNIRVITVNQDNAKIATAKEPYYGVEYGYKKIESTVIERWTNCGVHEELKFPSPNPFIPTLFDLKSDGEKKNETSSLSGSDEDAHYHHHQPKIIFDSALSRLWFFKDDEFFVPQATILLHIMNPYTAQSARNKTAQNLLVNLIDELLVDDTDVSAARKTGLDYALTSLNNGIALKVQGYDHKINLLFDKILQFCLNLAFTPTATNLDDVKVKETEINNYIHDQFEETKEAYIREKKNAVNVEPNEKARRHVKHLLSTPYYTQDQLLSPAKDLTLDDVLEYARLIFSSKVRLQWLIQGNVLKSEALQWHHSGLNHFHRVDAQPMLPSEFPLAQQVKLAAGSCLLYQEKEETSALSAVHLYFQTVENNNNKIEEQQQQGVKRDQILLMFMELFLRERCYDTLRSKENLGYRVYCKRCNDDGGCGVGVTGFEIIVQSTKHPNFIESRIHNFLQNIMAPTINNITLEDFTNHKTAVETLLKSQKPKTLNLKAVALARQIEKGTYDFDRIKERLKLLDKISLEMVKKFFNTWINPTSAQRKMLRIQIISTKAVGGADGMSKINQNFESCQKPELLVDTVEWKRHAEYFTT